MRKSPWCPVCVAIQIRIHGRFNGTENLNRIVTKVRDIECCQDHIVPLSKSTLDEIVEAAALEASASSPANDEQRAVTNW